MCFAQKFRLLILDRQDVADMTGIREDVARQMTSLEERFTDLKTDVNRQEETIANRLKVVRFIRLAFSRTVGANVKLILPPFENGNLFSQI